MTGMTTALVDHALSIGADPRDTTDERFRKRLLVGVALVILPVALVWGSLYWLVGERAVALTPWAYAAGSAISLGVFARTRSFAFLRTAQLLLILLAPALGTIMIGGLDESNAPYEARRCLSCGNCFSCDNCYGVCPDNAVIKLGDPGERYAIDYDFCKGCGLCVAECPSGAIEMVPETI